MICLPLLALLLAPLLGCAAGGRPWVELRGQRFNVEIADAEAERNRGLMFRDQMAPTAGMLFVYDAERPLAFWMKNTRIPLDILYFDAERRLVSARTGVPPCSLGDRCPPYPSTAPALYVLELNAGTAARLGVTEGDELVFGPGIPERGAP
ncbi:DUF192 domain-containing protein [Arenimonas sp.]|uniref:DUF192 domain-containing protein n=1 Tax=Arenimonas sp. TaxID=1872635 RepID=UPI0039C89D9D